MAIAPEDLTVDLTMPMKNMAPMTAKVELESADGPGRFTVNTFLGMKGEWELEATVNSAEQSGSALLNLAAE